MTLNDFERCKGHVVCIISPNSVDFRPYYTKVVEDRLIHLQVACGMKNVVFNGISLMAISAGITSIEGVKV